MTGSGHHQKPLSLRFESEKFWPDFCTELDVDQTGAAIIMDICTTDEWVSYSRRAQHYDRPRRYQNPLYTWRRVVSQIDRLATLGLIEHDKRQPGQRGWQSAIYANDDLRAIHNAILGNNRLMLAKPAEVIWLRDKSSRLIDYRETQVIHRMRCKVERFNEAIMSCAITPSVAAPLVRIWNETMQRGGRFYAMGNSWQNMKADARRCLTIGGERVVELDYCTLHPAILYAEVDAVMPSDCYDLPEWPRKLVKVAMLTLINATTMQKARLSIAHKAPWPEFIVPGSQDALRKASWLIEAIKKRHKPIADAFHSDAGARLMGLDAAIAEAVMNIMLLQGIVVLPVHDSFLVPVSQADKLEEAMIRAAYDIGRLAVRVDAK